MIKGDKYLWFTDTHLDTSYYLNKLLFLKHIKNENPEGIFLSGDISDGSKLTKHLEWLAKNINCNIYFVLGNHDYYNHTFEEQHSNLRRLCKQHTNLKWLTELPAIPLTKKTCLIGTEGWYDCAYGNPELTRFTLDWIKIKNLWELPDHTSRISYFQMLANKSADIIEQKLVTALENYKNIYLITHFPCWLEATRDVGTLLEPFWLPYNVNSTLGKRIQQIMKGRKKRKLTVLCGHSHVSNMVHISRNINCIVGDASYTKPTRGEQRIYIR